MILVSHSAVFSEKAATGSGSQETNQKLTTQRLSNVKVPRSFGFRSLATERALKLFFLYFKAQSDVHKPFCRLFLKVPIGARFSGIEPETHNYNTYVGFSWFPVPYGSAL